MKAFRCKCTAISDWTITPVTLQPSTLHSLRRNSLLQQPLGALALTQRLRPLLPSPGTWSPVLVPTTPGAALPAAFSKQRPVQHAGGSIQNQRHRHQVRDVSFQRTTDAQALHSGWINIIPAV